MNYLIIKNNGLICEEDLMLIGSSSKIGQDGKIGMFGSGWKYSLAWLLRNGCTPKIFAGEKEIEIDFQVRMHRNNAVNVITVNGNESSLTTEMGPKWTGWMALREILSNAIDEGGHSITTQWLPNFKSEENITTIYVPMNSELSEVMMSYDRFFSFNRKENYNTKYGRVFVKKEPSELNIYRKGIRCYDTKKTSILDFDFNDLEINEDRLASEFDISYEIRKIISENTNSTLLGLFLEEGILDRLPYEMNDNVLSCITELHNSGRTFTTPTLVKLGGVMFSNPDALFVRPEWYKKLQDLGMVKNPLDFFDGSFTFIRTGLKKCEGIEYYLKGFGVSPEILSGKMESNVQFKDGTAFVKDDTIMTDKQVAAEILGKMRSEDFVHYLK